MSDTMLRWLQLKEMKIIEHELSLFIVCSIMFPYIRYHMFPRKGNILKRCFIYVWRVQKHMNVGGKHLWVILYYILKWCLTAGVILVLSEAVSKMVVVCVNEISWRAQQAHLLFNRTSGLVKKPSLLDAFINHDSCQSSNLLYFSWLEKVIYSYQPSKALSIFMLNPISDMCRKGIWFSFKLLV